MKLNFFVIVILCFLQIQLVLSECTTSQNEKLEYCYNKYLNSFEMFEDSREYHVKTQKIRKTWPGFTKLCNKFYSLQECLGDEVMENCMKYDEFLELFDNGLDMAVNYEYLTYTCGRGFTIKKLTFNCMKEANILCPINENDDCHTVKSKLIKCANQAKNLCGKNGYIYQFNQAWATVKPLFSQCNIEFMDENMTDESVYSHENDLDKNDNENEELLDETLIMLFDKTLTILTYGNNTEENFIEVLPFAVESLKSANTPLKLKALNVLKLAAKKSVSNCHAILEAEAIPLLIELIKSPDFDIFEAALQTLTEINERSHRFRNYCIDQGILDPLIEIASTKKTSAKILIPIGILIGRILYHRGSPRTDEIISALLPTLNMFLNHEDSSLQMIAVGSFNYFTNENYIELFIQNGVVTKIIGYVKTSDSVRLHLRFFQKIIDECSDSDIQYLLDNDILENLHKFLKHYNDDVKLETIELIFSFVKYANGTQKHAIISDTKFLSSIFSLLEHKNPSIRSSTVELLLAIVNRANSTEINSMIDSNAIYQLCSMLKDDEMPMKILEIFVTVLFSADEETSFSVQQTLQICDANTILFQHTLSKNKDIEKHATNLMHELFDVMLWKKHGKKSEARDEL